MKWNKAKRSEEINAKKWRETKRKNVSFTKRNYFCFASKRKNKMGHPINRDVNVSLFFWTNASFFSSASLKTDRFVSFLKWENSARKKRIFSFFYIIEFEFFCQLSLLFLFISLKSRKNWNFSFQYWINKKNLCFIYLFLFFGPRTNASFRFNFINKL